MRFIFFFIYFFFFFLNSILFLLHMNYFKIQKKNVGQDADARRLVSTWRCFVLLDGVEVRLLKPEQSGWNPQSFGQDVDAAVEEESDDKDSDGAEEDEKVSRHLGGKREILILIYFTRESLSSNSKRFIVVQA